MDIDIDITQPEEATPIELDVSTGVSYPILDNKPQINGIELVGNKTANDLGLQPKGDYLLRGEINIDGSISGDGFATKEELNKKANKSELSTVAFSGSYSDLKNRPTVPTKTSQLTNDSGFLTQHQSISHLATKTELANKQDKGNYALKSEIPTKTSSLTNDSGFLTEHQDISGKQDKLIAGNNITIVNNVISATGGNGGGTSVDAYTKTETDNLLSQKQDKGDYALNSAIPTKVSQLENDLGFTTGAVDASNLATKEFAISASLPSARYTEMTLGATGSTVIAPDNGYFHIDMVPGVTGAYVTLNNLTTGILLTNWTINPGDYARVLAPCRKGDEIKVTYKALKTLNKFRFYYPEGAE